jgi:hypothetical protein
VSGGLAFHAAEHLVAQRKNEREAVIALHPADGNPHELPFGIEDAAARDTRMAVGEARHQAVGRLLPHVAGRDDDALRVVVAEAEDGVCELELVAEIGGQRRQVDVFLDLEDRPVTRIDFDAGIARVDDLGRDRPTFGREALPAPAR